MSEDACAELNKQMKTAIEKLGTEKESKTKFAHVKTYEANNKLYHGLCLRQPYINDEGKVAYNAVNGTTFDSLNLDNAVQEALVYESRIAALDAYKREMADLIGASTVPAK